MQSESVPIAPLVERASEMVFQEAVASLKNMTNYMRDYDILIPTGGTCSLWMDKFKEHFKGMKSLTVIPGNRNDKLPLLYANVRGYFMFCHMNSKQVVDLKIRIRLYHYHDLDLVSLYREGRISIPKAVKLTLNAFARKRYVRLETVDKKCEKIAKPVYMFNIILDEKKDKDAIDLLNKIDKGYRNNFIKQLLRVYLCFVLPGCYTAQENLEYFAEREKGIFGEREVVPAPISRYVREKTSEQKRVTDAPIEVGGVIIKDLLLRNRRTQLSLKQKALLGIPGKQIL